MIWLVVAILVVLEVVLIIHDIKIRNGYPVVSILWGIVTLIIVIIPIGYTLSNGVGLAMGQTFYDTNVRNYEVTIDKTASYLSTEKFTVGLVAGSIEKFQQSQSVSDRIKEWRDSVNQYNKTITSMKYFNRNVFTGVLVPDEVDDMKLIIIQ